MGISPDARVGLPLHRGEGEITVDIQTGAIQVPGTRS